MLFARILGLESPCAEEVFDIVYMRILQVFLQVITLGSFHHGDLLHLAGKIAKGKPAADIPNPFEEPTKHDPLLLHVDLPLLHQLSNEAFTKLPIKPPNTYHVGPSQPTLVVGCHFNVVSDYFSIAVVCIPSETVELVSYRVRSEVNLLSLTFS